MVERNDSWIFSPHIPWHLHSMECMNMPLEQRRSECLPTGSAVPGIPGLNKVFAVPGISSLKVEETYEATRLLQHLHPQFYPLYASHGLYPDDKQHIFTNGLTGMSTPCAISGSPQRKLIVFDRSGNQTRLIYNSVCPAQHQTTITAKNLLFPGLHEENKALDLDQFTTTKGNMQVFNEEGLNGEETETHEDTEEINALLYSDETDDNSESDDEVTSTDHSPLAVKRSYHKQEQQPKDIMDEEVASCDGPHKRQKLFDGKYNQISLMDTASSVQLKGSNTIGSSYAIGQTQEKKPGSTPDCDGSRKDKIRNTLKILGNIIPNAKEKDPLLVIDEAINYLTFLKRKADVLGMKYY